MNYWLNDNVLITFGKVKSLIYDLRDDYVKVIWNNKNQTTEILNYILKKQKTKFITELNKFGLLSFNEIKNLDIHNKNINFDLFNFAWIEITNKCNFECIHCYGSFSPNNYNEINFNNIELITKELKSLNINNIQIIGGEPFVLEKNILKKTLIYLKKHFDNIEIYTNGYFLNSEWINFLKKYNIKLSISIYHHQDNIHNKVTQNNISLKKIQQAIKDLEEANIEYRLGYIKMKFNKDFNEELLKQKLNTNAPIKIDNMRIVGRGSIDLIDDEILKDKSITLSTFAELKLKSNNVKKNLYHHNCFSNKFYISSDLDVYPCVMERRIKYGNLKDNTLKEILSSQCKIVNLTKDNIESCKVCEFKYVCFDCRPDSISQNLKAKPYFCKYNPIKGEWYD